MSGRFIAFELELTVNGRVCEDVEQEEVIAGLGFVLKAELVEVRLQF